MAWARTWDWAAQFLGIVAPDPSVRTTSLEAPLRAGNFAPIAESQPDSTVLDALPSTSNASVIRPTLLAEPPSAYASPCRFA